MLEVLPDLRFGLAKTTMRARIATRIARMIQSGLLRLGDEIPSERELAQTLDVSRETVRGAMQILAAIGMIEVSQGARTRIIASDVPGAAALVEAPGVSRYTAEEAYNARRVVETWVIREAARRVDRETLTRLRGLVDEQSTMEDDPVRFQISDAEFHGLLYRSGGNRLLADFLNEVYGYALADRRRALLEPGAVGRSVQDHRRILKALEAKDPDAAQRAMSRHLTRVHRTTLQIQAGTR